MPCMILRSAIHQGGIRVFEPFGLKPVEPEIPMPPPAHEPKNSDAANYLPVKLALEPGVGTGAFSSTGTLIDCMHV